MKLTHPHFIDLRNGGLADVADVLEFDGDCFSISYYRWMEAERFFRDYPCGSTLRDIISHRRRMVGKRDSLLEDKLLGV